FWTNFGQYMRPVKGVNGDTINWLNYKTGTRHLYFRMDVQDSSASVAIEMRHPDDESRKQSYEHFLQVKNLFSQAMGEAWDWKAAQPDEDGQIISRINKTLNGVNIFNDNDWPAIISFLKQRIMALDQFWMEVKDGFE
ncbi:MAG: DUF4268 domain-containing protein, partial [Bacteroidota bacterium]